MIALGEGSGCGFGNTWCAADEIGRANLEGSAVNEAFIASTTGGAAAVPA